MKAIMKFILLVMAAAVMTSCGGRQNVENVVVGDLAYLELQPGSQVDSISTRYEDYRLDERARIINADEGLIEIHEVVAKSPKDVNPDLEAFLDAVFPKSYWPVTVMTYETSNADDPWSGVELMRMYDANGRLIYKWIGLSEMYFVYDDDNRIAFSVSKTDEGVQKEVYKYDENGCRVGVEYMVSESYELNDYDSMTFTPFVEDVINVKEVDENGNWTVRIYSSQWDGEELQERTIVYKTTES